MAQRWLPILPAILLAAVALHQLYAVRAHDLTPWKGGGFGMFASTDVGPARRLEVWLLRGASSVRVQIPEELREHLEGKGVLGGAGARLQARPV